MIYIEPRHLEIVKKILADYPYCFYVYGSRATGKQRRFSDLDLCSLDNIPERILGEIAEKFEESDLPYKVDLLNWQRCKPEFKNIIKKDLMRLF